jgi:hypothetical protein
VYLIVSKVSLMNMLLENTGDDFRRGETLHTSILSFWSSRIVAQLYFRPERRWLKELNVLRLVICDVKATGMEFLKVVAALNYVNTLGETLKLGGTLIKKRGLWR